MRGLEALREDPLRPRPKADIRPHEGTAPPEYGLRAGDWRAVCALVDDELKVVEDFRRSRS